MITKITEKCVVSSEPLPEVIHVFYNKACFEEWLLDKNPDELVAGVVTWMAPDDWEDEIECYASKPCKFPTDMRLKNTLEDARECARYEVFGLVHKFKDYPDGSFRSITKGPRYYVAKCLFYQKTSS